MRILQDAARYRGEYASAQPFPHIVLDDLWPQDVLERILAEFPAPDSIDWKVMVTPREKKLATKDLSMLGETSRNFLLYLNSSPVVNFMETLTSIEHLVPDPHYWGGGLHQIPRGGFLKVHADFNWHHRLELCRRINLLIYLNKDWKEEYVGELELWERDMRTCRRKVLPVFNRTVVFSTTDFAYHGHPTPLNCPEDRTRKSIAIYYYSNGRPKEESSGAHSTLYQRRGPQDWEDSAKDRIERWGKLLVPPIVFDAKRRLKTKFFPNLH